ncbi:MAG TPA: RNA methyltransferase [Pseudonocardiaceae bacterium]
MSRTSGVEPGVAPFTEKTPRVSAARRLTRRAERDKAGRFLAEGSNALECAIELAERDPRAIHPEGVGPRQGVGIKEVFVTERFATRNADLLARAAQAGARVSPVTESAAAALSETVTPQGVITVCELLDRSLADALSGAPMLVAVLVGIADPGNAGTVLRVADAAGADAVLFAGDSVDPYNGKAVRASAGSLFHLPIARSRVIPDVLDACTAAGLRLVAADAHAQVDLDDAADSGLLAEPTAWLFGSEAHGLDEATAQAAQTALRVPIHGAAESLNLAAAAAVCLYASARGQRRRNAGATR